MTTISTRPLPLRSNSIRSNSGYLGRSTRCEGRHTAWGCGKSEGCINRMMKLYNIDFGKATPSGFEHWSSHSIVCRTLLRHLSIHIGCNRNPASLALASTFFRRYTTGLASKTSTLCSGYEVWPSLESPQLRTLVAHTCFEQKPS